MICPHCGEWYDEETQAQAFMYAIAMGNGPVIELPCGETLVVAAGNAMIGEEWELEIHTDWENYEHEANDTDAPEANGASG